MITLFPQQETLLDAARKAMRRFRRVCIQSPTGSGKTAIASVALLNAAGKGAQSFFIVHRQELLEQTAATMEKVGVPYSFIAAGRDFDPHKPVQICSIDTLKNRIGKLNLQPRLIVIDECFTPDILVDGKRIDTLKRGDMVWSYNHSTDTVERKRITHVHKSTLKGTFMCRVMLSDGRHITCTAGHPFYCRGADDYVKAIDLKPGMQLVRQGGGVEHQEQAIQSTGRPAGLLLKRLLNRIQGQSIFRDYGAHQSQIRQRSDDSAQSDAQSGVAAEDVRNIKAHWSRTASAWREWVSTYETAADYVLPAEGFRDGAATRIYRAVRNGARQWMADTLLTGHRIAGAYGRYRNRWRLSLQQGATGAGSEKGQVSAFTRVVGVEVYEPERNAQPGHLCANGFVYNLAVDGNHNYFANGVLVHNCHHARAKGWEKVLHHYQHSYQLGLTATPCRLDGRPLADMCDTLVCGPSISSLMLAGRLNRYKLYAPSTPDLTGVRKVAGDYSASALVDRMDREIVGDAVAHYKKYAYFHRAVVFACTIDHAYTICTRFNMAGIPSEVLTGKDDADTRRRVLREFATGTLRVVVNVNLFCEGFDLSAAAKTDVQVGCVIAMRPTDSLSLWLQMVGRALRPQDRGAVILDHAGNTMRHGLPDDDREWTLEGGVIVHKSRSLEDERVKQCEKCYFCYEPHLQACPECGYAPPRKVRVINEVDGELTEVDAEKIALKKQQSTARSYDDLLAIEQARGYKPGWARHVYNARIARKMAGG